MHLEKIRLQYQYQADAYRLDQPDDVKMLYI